LAIDLFSGRKAPPGAVRLSKTLFRQPGAAGLSAAVSRAFSAPGKMREAIRRKVYKAAAVLHYSPWAIVQAMVQQRSGKIAYLNLQEGRNYSG